MTDIPPIEKDGVLYDVIDVRVDSPHVVFRYEVNNLSNDRVYEKERSLGFSELFNIEGGFRMVDTTETGVILSNKSGDTAEVDLAQSVEEVDIEEWRRLFLLSQKLE